MTRGAKGAPRVTSEQVRALLVASDPARDIAILRFDPAPFPEAIPAPLAAMTDNDAGVLEGERVFTIGSPLSQRKIVTSGIVDNEPYQNSLTSVECALPLVPLVIVIHPASLTAGSSPQGTHRERART